MDKITPCLWFDGDAEEAAAFYVSLLPDSRIDRVVHSPARLLEMIGSEDRAAAERAMKAMMEMVKLDLPTLEAAYRGEG